MIRESILSLTDEELLYILEDRLPGLLDRHPEMRRRVKMLFIDTLARDEEVAAIMAELRALRADDSTAKRSHRNFRDGS